ncbi:MAG: nucleotidyltransferase domain-containing protein [Pseudomonadota bacterium]
MHATEDVLKALFSSKVRIEVLSHFFLNPEGKFYLRQLQRLLDAPVTPLRRELQSLEAVGLLLSWREGNQKRYGLNPLFPLREELRAIFVKTTGGVPAIKAALERLAGIRLAFIYGSWTKGGERPRSDIDVMVIGDVSDLDLSQVFQELEKSLGMEVNYSLYSEAEAAARKGDVAGFIHTVLSEPKIVLIGGEDDRLLSAD